METDDPAVQKKLGREVKDFNVEDWSRVARKIVYDGNFAKFTQHPHLFLQLVNTYPTTLVEASPYDKVWGIGLSEDDPRALDKDQWQGKNWLGEVLTHLRNDLMKGLNTEGQGHYD